MEGLVKRYRSILIVGIVLVTVSFFVGILRLYNQAYIGTSIIEEILRAYTEIVPLFGLGILKLGIGFAIVTIVINLRATGKSARASLAKIDKKPPEMNLPIFTRIFPKLLVLGILVEMVAVFISIGWMAAGSNIIDSKLLHTFEVLAEPIEGLGVSLLIGGIALGLATIVLLLSKQATAIPRKLSEIATGQEFKITNKNYSFPKWNLIITYLGMTITATGLLPLAFIRLNVEIWHPLWENWMFIGIGTMLFSISFWLLTIIKWLRTQRENLGKTVAESARIEVPRIEPPSYITKIASILTVLGLLWMISFFGLACLGANGMIGSLNPIVRPGKAIGLSLIFLGIGLDLLMIVVNLKLTAFMLPGAFSKIVSVIKGEKVEGPPRMSVANPMLLAPKKLYLGIIIASIVVTLGTFPLAWVRVVVGPSDSLFLIIERIIGTTVALGVGLIFFFIGMFFNTIVTFVKGRRTMISEGVETCVYYASEKKS